LQPYFYFKIDKATNKLSFEKRSANEFIVDPLDLERVRHENFKMSRVSIEFYHWDSNIEKDNELKQRMFDEYEKYRNSNDESFPLPKQLTINKFSQLELFYALSVSTNTDQFLEEITTEMRVEMPEIKKHLNVLFSRQTQGSIKNLW
jgi:response regulator of citrate/malate metabolism